MELRKDLPPLPPLRMLSLPLDHRGYPVPWFVAFINGVPDFRIIRPSGTSIAIKKKVCWLCGQPLGRHLSFVIGPMCAINRTTSEPPCHRKCAEFAVKACPFMVRPRMKRNTSEFPDGYAVQAPAGVHLDRNPGAMCLWNTRSFKPFRVNARLPSGDGILIEIGEPESVSWWAEGRPATREEVQASIDGGYPQLLQVAEDEGLEAVVELNRYVARMQPLLPP